MLNKLLKSKYLYKLWWVGVIIFNASTESFEISQGDRIAQAVLVPVSKIDWELCETLPESVRNEFGSSGKEIKIKMIVTEIYLVTRNARDKVQVVLAELEQVGSNFIIMRTTGQYKGKMTEQPNISIEKGKAKRSALQQAELEV